MHLQQVKYWLLITMAAFLFACSGSSTPEQVAEKHVKAMAEGNLDELMETIHISSEEKAQLDMVKGKLDGMIAVIADETKKAGGIRSVKATETTYKEDDQTRATIAVNLEFKNGKQQQERVSLLKVAEGWKVAL